MSSSSTTDIEPEAMRRAADKLEDLVTEDILKKFDNLRNLKLEAGSDGEGGGEKFDAAIWLEAIVKDRFDGLYFHVEALQAACTFLGSTLRRIATIFEETDVDGAGALNGKIADEINDWILDVKSFDLPDTEGEDSYDRSQEDGGVAYSGFNVSGQDGSAIFLDPNKKTVEITMPDDLAVDNILGGLDPDDMFEDAREEGDWDGGDKEFVFTGKLVDGDAKNTNKVIIDTDDDPEN